MKPSIKYFIVSVLICTLLANCIFAQIIIQPDPPLESLVERVVGELQFENVTYQGTNVTKSLFENAGTTNLGMDRGIILCTGDPYYIPGPNTDCFGVWPWNDPGHPLLDAIQSDGITRDAAVLEYDVIPETDTLTFSYVFASEHYPDWGTFYSDVFGCFISGPDPEGGYYTDKNIALLPEAGNITIQISTINNGYAPCGIIPMGPCVNCEYLIDNTNGQTLEYDAFTVLLDMSIPVIPCESYHVFMGIADGGLMSWSSSAVFIRESTYKTPALDISLHPSASDTILRIVEGCEGADIIFKLPNVDYAPLNVFLDYSQGEASPSAYPPGDFEEMLPEQISFEEGEDSVAIHLAPATDDDIEYNELLRIIVGYTLTCNMKYDTVDIILSDHFPMQIDQSENTSICAGDSTDIWVNPSFGSGPYFLEWGVNSSNDDTITVSPDSSTWYTFQIYDNCQDTVNDSIFVDVIPIPLVDLGPDTTICSGDTLVLQNSTGDYENYLWSTGDTTATISVYQPGTYSLSIVNSCGADEGAITVDQWPYPDPGLGPDLELCFGETAFLQATQGFLSYTWQDNSTEDFYTVTQSGLYFVNVEDVHGCTGADSVLAFIGNIVQLEDKIGRASCRERVYCEV